MSDKVKRWIGSPAIHRILIALFSFSIYIKTLAPTVMWYDMGEYQTASYLLGIAHNTGYPLYLLLGKLFTFLPVGDIGYRVNLMSAFFGAATIYTAHLLIFYLTKSNLAASSSALALAVSSTIWSNATWAEVYNLNAFLSLLILYLMVLWLREKRTWQINLAFGLFGLSLGNHRLILAVGSGLALVFFHQRKIVEKSWSWKEAFRLLCFFLLGFSVHLYLPIRSLQGAPVQWDDASEPLTFLKMITTGYASSQAFYNPFGDLNQARILFKMLYSFPVYEWTIAGLVISFIGAYRNFKKYRVFFMVTLWIILLTLVMVSVYGIHDIFNYYHPIYLMIAIWFGYGVSSIVECIGEKVDSFIDKPRLNSKGKQVVVFLLLLIIPLTLFDRNYDHVDKSMHHDSGDYADYLLNRVEPGSVIMADFWCRWPLLYTQLIEGVRPDVFVIPPADKTHDQGTEEIASKFLKEGIDVYYVQRSEDDLGKDFEDLGLDLIAPYTVHSLTTDVVPAPKYKDLLIPRGTIYKFRKGNHDKKNPAFGDHDLDIQIGEDLILRGCQIDDRLLRVGETYAIRYEWELAEGTDADYWVDVLFTDKYGGVKTVEGFPIWLQSHWIGSGEDPTSTWIPGEVVVEVYEGIVPRRVVPGAYQIRLLVYKDAPRENFQPARGPQAKEGRIIIDTVSVIP